MLVTAAVYARVSTADQDCLMQLAELRSYAARMGWAAPAEYVEKASGKRGSKRPVLAQLLADARGRRFDVLLIWKLDRFGRSVIDLAGNFATLDQCGVRVLIPSQGVDTDNRSPMGRFVVTMFGAIAEFERAIISERVTAGVAQYARDYAAGRIGRDRHSKSGKDLPPHRPRVIFRRDEAERMRKAGFSWRAIAKAVGVSVSAVRTALAA